MKIPSSELISMWFREKNAFLSQILLFPNRYRRLPCHTRRLSAGWKLIAVSGARLVSSDGRVVRCIKSAPSYNPLYVGSQCVCNLSKICLCACNYIYILFQPLISEQISWYVLSQVYCCWPVYQTITTGMATQLWSIGYNNLQKQNEFTQ